MALNKYDSRREVYVNPFTGSGIKYGFLTNIEESRGATLGHVAVNRSALTFGLVFGANAPKPGRASRRFSDGTTSSYYDVGNYATLRAGGWSLKKPSLRRARSTNLAEARFVTIEGIKYAWMCPSSTITRIGGDAASLGIQTPTQADMDLVWGASYPKPPRASKTIDSGSEVDRVSTYIDPSRADNLPDGWAQVGREEAPVE